MKPAFLPVSLDSISPTIDLEATVNGLVESPLGHDYSLFWRRGDVDTMSFKIDGKMLSLEEATPILQKQVNLYQNAAEKVLAALRSGGLRSYVMKGEDGSIWQIPRFYWNQRGPHELAHALFQPWGHGVGEHPSMEGLAVIISEQQYATWRSGLPASPTEVEKEPTPAQQPDGQKARPCSIKDLEQWAAQQARDGLNVRDVSPAELAKRWPEEAQRPGRDRARAALRKAKAALGKNVQQGRPPKSKPRISAG